jgi:hypothetical protein
MVSTFEGNNRFIAEIAKTIKRIAHYTNPSTCLLVVAEGRQGICGSHQTTEAAPYDGKASRRYV